nr:MAG TPA: hypothetical protein [Caudoviricetes sp.]DAE86422.1 MAG TPA: hypothetical protein [Caudoviricetes sp.]DAX91672.1 MAG TPA: hypothetical protein [Caudoviricetes sp.]
MFDTISRRLKFLKLEVLNRGIYNQVFRLIV